MDTTWQGQNAGIYDNTDITPQTNWITSGGKAAAYPDIYYKLQAHVLEMCDYMDMNGIIPTKQQLERASDSIYNEVISQHPDIAEYAHSTQSEARPAITYDLGLGGQRAAAPASTYRPRSLLRALIDILLISEFYRRRRR